MGHKTGGLTHATVRKNVISGNTATSGEGGGIFACAGPIQNNVICGNYAPALGAGILVCLGRIEKNHICDNVSGGLGGGPRPGACGFGGCPSKGNRLRKKVSLPPRNG